MPAGYPDWHKGVKADIIAQTLEKIAVDIVAATVGTLGIDIKAQTISELDIDVQAQTIAELTERWKYGKVSGANFTTTIPAETSQVVFSVTGKGYFIWGLFTPEHDLIDVELEFDGDSLVWSPHAHALNSLGFGNASPFYGLLKYTAGGECAFYILPPFPLSFESSFKIWAGNSDTTEHEIGVVVYYALL